MMTQTVVRYTHDRLTPLVPMDQCVILPVRLVASTTFRKGERLGEAAATANDLQTFTATGTPTGGSYTFTVTPPSGNPAALVIPYNCTSSALQTLANAAFGSGTMTAGGGPWPGTALTLTATGTLAGQPVPVAVATTNGLTGGATPSASVAHTTVGVTKGDMGPYDGATYATAKALLEVACVTDGAGQVSYGAQSPGVHAQQYQNAPAYFKGVFKAADIPGLDATSAGQLGRLWKGSTSNGVLSVY